MRGFTSSNNLMVEELGPSYFNVVSVTSEMGGKTHVCKDVVEALREYFQYVQDTRLGRWRYTDSLVVYPVENHQPCNISRAVQVLDERDGKTYERYEGRVPGEDTTPEATEAARAYFEAHPEPKPWHDAENGQLWLLRFEDFPARDVSALVKGDRFVYNDQFYEGVASLDDPEIISGKRIWPE